MTFEFFILIAFKLFLILSVAYSRIFQEKRPVLAVKGVSASAINSHKSVTDKPEEKPSSLRSKLPSHKHVKQQQRPGAQKSPATPSTNAVVGIVSPMLKQRMSAEETRLRTNVAFAKALMEDKAEDVSSASLKKANTHPIQKPKVPVRRFASDSKEQHVASLNEMSDKNDENDRSENAASPIPPPMAPTLSQLSRGKDKLH